MANPDSGGAELYTQEIFSRIANRYGKDVTLFASMFGSAKSEENVNGVKIIRRGSKCSVYREAKKYYLKNKSEFDLVVDEINTRPFQTPEYVSCPIIAIIHQMAKEYWWYETPFPVNVLGYYYLENHWLQKYVGIPTITVSNSSATELRKFGFRSLSVVENGAPIGPLDQVPKKAGKFTIVFLARLKKVKRPIDALEAFKLCSAKEDIQLIIIGDGPLRSRLEKQYLNLHGVSFVGRASEELKTDILKKSHLHIAPYLKEGWGNSVIEAAAVGTPTIGYETTGLVDSVTHERTGLLVQKFNVKGLAKAIEYLKANPSKLEEMSKNCLAWSHNFSWDKASQEFNTIIDRVLCGQL